MTPGTFVFAWHLCFRPPLFSPRNIIATISKQPIDIFISFGQQDRALAERVARELASQGLSVFVDGYVAVEPAGAVLEKRIWNAIAESKAMIMINPSIPKNGWQGIELEAATA